MNNAQDLRDALTGAIAATSKDDELSLVTCLNGYTRETLLDAWFVRTGEREIEPCE